MYTRAASQWREFMMKMEGAVAAAAAAAAAAAG